MKTGRRHTVTLSIALAALLLASTVLVLGFAAAVRTRRTPVVKVGPFLLSSSDATMPSGSLEVASSEAATGLVGLVSDAGVGDSLSGAAGSAGVGVKKLPKAPKAPAIDAYKGLGSWIDIYDDRAWTDPAGAVRDMASRGVRTVYVETSNSRSPSAIMKPAELRTIITEAHRRKMRVVAWYLPDMTNVGLDYARIEQAIKLRTATGEKFDGFALDIESTAVSSEGARNAALDQLTKRIRALVGKDYALGGIIPSPAALSKKNGYWDAFPYTMVARNYQVVLPMGYYTYHGSGVANAREDTLANVRVLRAQPGCAKVPIHLIGGIAENSSGAEVHAFVQTAMASKVYGASLYGWPGTSAAQWGELRAVR